MNKIKIKEESIGRFSAWARSRGMTVQEAASKILRNREKYSPTLIKRANFARNSARFDGGGIITSMGTGALSGAALGPWGAAAGAGVGLVKGLVETVKENKAGNLEAELLNQQKIKESQMAQAGIFDNYTPTFKTGGLFKGKKYGSNPNAIVGGGEIVIDQKGNISNMKGPSDTNGGSGIPVELANGTMIINKKDSKDILPLTSKINKNKEILEGNASKLTKNSSTRNLNKYYSKVLDTYNAQEAKKMSKGGKFQVGGMQYLSPYGTADRSIYPFPNGSEDNPYGLGNVNVTGNKKPFKFYEQPGIQGATPAGNGFTPRTDIGNDLAYSAPRTSDIVDPNYKEAPLTGKQYNFNFSNPQDNPNSPSFDPAASKVNAVKGMGGDNGFDWASIGEMAPMLYNLGQGLFGKRDKMNAGDYANPYEGKINSLMANRRYNIDAPLASNEAAFRTTAANMRNLGGSRGQVMANLTGAQNTKQFGDMTAYGQQNNVNNQYRADQAQMMYPLGRDRAMTRMSVDESNQMTDAAGRNMVGAGMTGLQQYLLTRRQMKGQAKRDDMLLKLVDNYSPYSKKWTGR